MLYQVLQRLTRCKRHTIWSPLSKNMVGFGRISISNVFTQNSASTLIHTLKKWRLCIHNYMMGMNKLWDSNAGILVFAIKYVVHKSDYAKATVWKDAFKIFSQFPHDSVIISPVEGQSKMRNYNSSELVRNWNWRAVRTAKERTVHA